MDEPGGQSGTSRRESPSRSTAAERAEAYQPGPGGRPFAESGHRGGPAPPTGQTEAPKAGSIAGFPKPVQDAVIKELGRNPTLLAAEERRKKSGVDYSVRTGLPEDRELHIRILASGYVLFREVSGLTLEEVPAAVRAAAEKELGESTSAPGVEFVVSRKTREQETTYTLLCRDGDKIETRLEILDNGRPSIKRETKELAELPGGVQDTVNKETATIPGAAATVQWVTKFDWQGNPEERFFAADIRGNGPAVDLKLDERGSVLDREER